MEMRLKNKVIELAKYKITCILTDEQKTDKTLNLDEINVLYSDEERDALVAILTGNNISFDIENINYDEETVTKASALFGKCNTLYDAIQAMNSEDISAISQQEQISNMQDIIDGLLIAITGGAINV